MDANLRKVPVPLAEDLIKTIRLLALFGRKMFVIYLFQPLDEAGWKRNPANDPARKMLERIKTASAETTAIHTIGPLSKRLISQALNETLSMTGDASIFFLEKMMEHNQAAISREAIEFVQIIEPSLAKFQKIYQEKSSVLFSEALQKMSPADFKNAFAPIDLGRSQIRVEMQQEAAILFNKIQIAKRNDDMPRCRKLIAHYMVTNADQEDNSMEQVRELVTAFEKRNPGFRAELEDFIAISLHYQAVSSITQGDIKSAIRSIRKYAHIFQGNPEVKYHMEIDRMESKLYDIITEKGLWSELKKGD